MRIIKIGTFTEQGFPTNWHIDGTDMKDGEHCFGIINEKVCVNGVEIVEWTEKRREIMKENFITGNERPFPV